jgi:hypothetical protein
MKFALLTLFVLVFYPVAGRSQTLDQCDNAGNTLAAQDKLSRPTVPGVVPGCDSRKLPVDPPSTEGSTVPLDVRDQTLLPGDSEPAPFGGLNSAATTPSAPAESAGLSAPPSAFSTSPRPTAPPPAQSRRGTPILVAAASLILGTLVFGTLAASKVTGVMERPSWLSRRCRYCFSDDVRPSRKQGPFESVFLPLLLLAPFRCAVCFRRCYGFVFVR